MPELKNPPSGGSIAGRAEKPLGWTRVFPLLQVDFLRLAFLRLLAVDEPAAQPALDRRHTDPPFLISYLKNFENIP